MCVLTHITHKAVIMAQLGLPLVAAAATAALAPRRVLCLQGKGGNGASMLSRLHMLRSTLGDGWLFECLDAPHEISSSGDCAWWINPPGERSYTASSYEGDDVSIAQVEAAWSAKEYDALLGFSQGAMLAAVVSARGLLGQGTVRPKCLVLMGAALPKPYESLLSDLSSPTTSAMASLHCLSQADTINPAELGEWVANCFGPDAKKLWHGSGHVIPGDMGARDGNTVAAVATFLGQNVKA